MSGVIVRNVSENNEYLDNKILSMEKVFHSGIIVVEVEKCNLGSEYSFILVYCDCSVVLTF